MVDKLKQILAMLHEANKDVSLFAVLKIDDITDRWSILFSAPDLDNPVKKNEAFVYLVKLLIENLTEQETESIARVGVFPLSNHLVQELLKFKTGYVISESTPVNGNVVHEGYILESNEPQQEILPST